MASPVTQPFSPALPSGTPHSWNVFGHSPLPMLIVEVPSQIVLDANDAAVQLFGVAPTVLVGSDFRHRVFDQEEDVVDVSREGPAARMFWGPGDSLVELFVFSSRLPGSDAMRVLTFINPTTVTTGRAHDPLTGLLTRDALGTTLNSALDRAEATAAVAFIDLDNFKAVNDTHGHLLGDEILVTAAHAIRAVIRSMDTAIRFGGDEFVIIMPRLNTAEDAMKAGRRICDAIARSSARAGHRTTASVGIALVNRQTHTQFDAMQSADAAMYAAKANGGNCTIIV